MLKSIKVWKIDEVNSRIDSKLTIRDASRFAFTEDGVIANDIIIDTTYISESVIMSVLEPKVYNGHQIFYYGRIQILDNSRRVLHTYNLPEIAGETFYTNFIIYNQRLIMEVNDKVFIYCYNVDDLPNKTPDFEEIKDLEGRSYFAIDKIKATNVKIVTKCNGHRSLKLKSLNFWSKI